jgi:RNase P/RNase MRP subunit POP5
MLKLKSSARNNRRYLLINGVKENFDKAVLEFIGVLGFAEADPFLVSKEKESFIVAVNRKSIVKVRAAISLSKDDLKILRVSGTLNGLKK